MKYFGVKMYCIVYLEMGQNIKQCLYICFDKLTYYWGNLELEKRHLGWTPKYNILLKIGQLNKINNKFRDF